jgi:sulfur transfer protein SufE
MLWTGDVHRSTERKFKKRKRGQLALVRGVIAIVILVMQGQTRASIVDDSG